jgi:hypothetical protein
MGKAKWERLSGRVQTVLPKATFSCGKYVQLLKAPMDDTCSASAVSAAVSAKRCANAAPTRSQCQTLCQRGADALQRRVGAASAPRRAASPKRRVAFCTQRVDAW